jgi:AraC-like DNA-binding protein
LKCPFLSIKCFFLIKNVGFVPPVPFAPSRIPRHFANGSSPCPVSVLALLPPRLLRHLQFILPRDRPPLVAKSWDDLELLIDCHPVSVAVIDPSADGVREISRFEQIMADYPSLPLVAYVSLNSESFRAVTELSQRGLKHAVLHTQDDAAERFLALLNRLQVSPLTSRFVTALRPQLNQLPIPVATAVENMFAEPHRYSGARDIAMTAKVPVIRLYRSFHSADLASPKRVLVAAKLLRAYGYLSDPGHSVRGIAKKLGYRHPRIFAEHTFEVFGLNPSRLRSHVTEAQAISGLLNWIGAIAETESPLEMRKIPRRKDQRRRKKRRSQALPP